jgi:hypothetical protein
VSSNPPPLDPSSTDVRPSVAQVRHRTERDSLGRVWRFVFDPAAQDAMGQPGMVRIRCTTGTARATMVVRDDWADWPRQRLLDELTAALRLQRGNAAATAQTSVDGQNGADRRIARRRLVRDASGTAWNCVYDPSSPGESDTPDRVRVRCSAGRDRIDLLLDPAWHRLGDKQIVALIAEAIEARRR